MECDIPGDSFSFSYWSIGIKITAASRVYGRSRGS